MRFYRPKSKESDERWDSFEIYKGQPLKKLPSWLDRVLIVFFGLLALSIVFLVTGFLFTLAIYRILPAHSAVTEDSWMPWARFLFGGFAGVILTLKWWFRSK